MDHVVPMRVGKRVRDGGGDLDRFIDPELRFAIQLVTQRLAVDERHDVIQERVGLARIEQRKDVRVLEIGGGRDFLHEAFGPEHRSEFGSQHLDRHLALVLEVLGEVDRRHAAFAEVALDLVAVREGGREAGGDLGHGAKMGRERGGGQTNPPGSVPVPAPVLLQR